MIPIEPFETASNFLEDMGMFEAATHAPATALPVVDASTVLLALDGSNQDEPARFLAGALAAALGASVVEKAGLESASIVNAVREARAQLLVLPVPFGADIGSLREESLGDVVDRLLLAAGIPILAVRQPLGEARLGAAIRRIVVPVFPGEARTGLALAWACRLLRAGGDLHAVEIADREVLAEANLLREPALGTDSTTQASIERVMTRQFASLIAAVQRTASEGGFGAHVVQSSGRFVAETLAAIGDSPGLIVITGSHDRRSTTFHRCADLILGSAYPVLVV